MSFFDLDFYHGIMDGYVYYDGNYVHAGNVRFAGTLSINVIAIVSAADY